MEGRPSVGGEQEASLEENLFQIYGQEELTLGQSTRTLGQWAELCPVDLSDSSVTLQQVNDYTVKFLNEGGKVIAPEHEGLFTSTVERLGLERKFTVSAPAKEQTARAEPAGQPSSTREQAASPVVETSRRSAQTRKRTVSVVAEQPVSEAAPAERRETPRPAAAKSGRSDRKHDLPQRLDLRAASLIREAEPSELIWQEFEPEEAAPELPEASELLGPHGAVRGDAVPPRQAAREQIEGSLAEGPDVHGAGIFADSLLRPADMGHEPVELLLPPRLMHRNAADSWVAELVMEPGDLPKAFSEVLRDFSDLPPLLTLEGADGFLHEEAGRVDLSEEEPLSLAPMVAERLAAFEPEGAAITGTLVRAMIGTIHGVHSLEAQEAAAEEIAALEAQLASLSEDLLDALNIEHDEAAVRAFVRVLRDPALKPAQETWSGTAPEPGFPIAMTRNAVEPAAPVQTAYFEAPDNWAEAAAVRPEAVGAAFGEALRSFAELPSSATLDTVPSNHDAGKDPQGDGLSAERTERGRDAAGGNATLALVVLVAEKLAEAEPEQAAAVGLLAEAVGDLHGLEARGMPMEDVAAAETRLETVSGELLAALGIDHDEEMIKQFVSITRDPGFQSLLEAAEPKLFSEHVGTREIKLHFPQLKYMLADVERHLQQGIGTFTLRCMEVQLAPVPVAA